MARTILPVAGLALLALVLVSNVLAYDAAACLSLRQQEKALDAELKSLNRTEANIATGCLASFGTNQATNTYELKRDAGAVSGCFKLGCGLANGTSDCNRKGSLLEELVILSSMKKKLDCP